MTRGKSFLPRSFEGSILTFNLMYARLGEYGKRGEQKSLMGLGLRIPEFEVPNTYHGVWNKVLGLMVVIYAKQWVTWMSDR